MHTTWDDISTGERCESIVKTSSIKTVSKNEADKAEINKKVIKKVADLWEASLAYEAMMFNEEGRFDSASKLFESNKMSYNLIIDSLEILKILSLSNCFKSLLRANKYLNSFLISMFVIISF